MIGINKQKSVTNYVYRAGSDFLISNVPRTTGWHEFKWDLRTAGRIDLYIDGTLIASPASAGNPFRNFSLGDLWNGDPIANTYIDDVIVKLYPPASP